jgi:hypothetical protein
VPYYLARQGLGQDSSEGTVRIDQAMNRNVNAIAGRLSLRPPRRSKCQYCDWVRNRD